MSAIDLGVTTTDTPSGIHVDTLVVVLITLAATACYYLISGLSVWVTPDTQSYMDASASLNVWSHYRHPAFGWILQSLDWLGGSGAAGFRAYVILQTAIYLASGAAMYVALRIYGVGRLPSTSVLLCIDFGNLPLLWHQAVHPEIIAVALLLCALSLVIRMTARSVRVLGLVLYAASLGAAVILRPSFLPAPIAFAALFVLLSISNQRRPRLFAAVALLCAGVALFVANASYRYLRVSDFNIVSLGGFNMSGIAGLMLTPDIVERLPARSRDIGAGILAARQVAESAGVVTQTPQNSSGARSFRSAALGYFDIYARTYDSFVWDVIRHTQGARDWIQFNAQLQRFSIDTFMASPLDYAAWVVGGSARTAGRMMVTNLSFGLGCLLLAGTWLTGLIAGARACRPASPDCTALVLLVAAFTITTAPLMVLVAFPASRYIDTCGLLLGALVIFPALERLSAFRGLICQRSKAVKDRSSRTEQSVAHGVE